MKNFKLLTSILIIFAASQGFCQQDEFRSANRMFLNENYGEAISVYNSIEASGYISPDLYFNLGNAYYRNGQLSEAILYLEKALKISPNRADIAHNLRLYKEDVQPEISEIPDFFLTRYWTSTASFFPSNIWAIFSIVMSSVCALGIAVWLIHNKFQTKKLGFYFAIGALFLSIVGFSLSATKFNMETKTNFAIVRQDQTYLMTGPDKRSQQKIELGRGIKVRLIDKIDRWYKVELADKELGWIAEDQLNLI